jgi:1-deoxy-D-xylulose-5-phosphate synthase
MPGSVGLTRFATEYPSRFFDVGIAEQHAVGSAAGLAMGGLHPVVALYGAFLNRAIDQVLMDLALHGLGVTIAIDRAGVTGDDGPSHNGVWDLALLQAVPGLRMAAPRDLPSLHEELGEALEIAYAPTAIRFPRGAVGPAVPTVRRSGGVDVLRESHAGVLVVAVGAMARTALEAAELCTQHGLETTVVDPRWVKPLPRELLRLAARYQRVVTVEDGLRTGGVGTALLQELSDAGSTADVHVLGVTDGFPEQGTRAEVLAEAGLTARSIADAVVSAAASRTTA